MVVWVGAVASSALGWAVCVASVVDRAGVGALLPLFGRGFEW